MPSGFAPGVGGGERSTSGASCWRALWRSWMPGCIPGRRSRLPARSRAELVEPRRAAHLPRTMTTPQNERDDLDTPGSESDRPGPHPVDVLVNLPVDDKPVAEAQMMPDAELDPDA